jgi:predicted MFS family arabinose efflux permease
LGVDVVTLGQLLSLRSAMGFFSPLLGALADRWGYRAVLRGELATGIIGLLLIGGSIHWSMAVIGMVLIGLGFFGFVPTLRAYLSFQLPYAQRARGFGILEYSWALSGIVGLYLMGKVIEAAGWRAPFFLLAAGLAVAWLVFAELPPASRTPATAISKGIAPATIRERMRGAVQLASNQRSAWCAIVAGAVVNFGSWHLYTVYGSWLMDEYGLQPSALGTVALILGCADLCGSGLASLIADRLGKRRGALLGLTGALLVCTAIPLLPQQLTVMVAALAISRFCFEFNVISHMSLVSEQAPTQRGKVLTLAFAVGLIGTTLSGFTAPPAYTQLGVWGLAPVAAVAIAVGLLLIAGWVRDPHPA